MLADPPRPRTRLGVLPLPLLVALIMALLAANWLVASLLLAPPGRTTVSYTFLLTQIRAANVATVTSTGDTLEGEFTEPAEYTPPGGSAERVERFTTRRPSFADDNLFATLQAGGVPVNAHPPDAPAPLWQRLLAGLGPALLLAASLAWFSRRSAGRTAAAAPPGVTFADVAGLGEAGRRAAEIVGFLREPEKYRRLGARIPRGVLLCGPPGVGKTLLAHAIAGEAGVPLLRFGTDPFPVRNKLSPARRTAPAIVFVEEPAAVAPDRISLAMESLTGENVIVLAATSRPEALDAALLRPGRFDRRITVEPPDEAGRRAILEVHTRGVPIAAGVDLGAIAAATPGLTGADLEHLINEAALLAARRGHDEVLPADLDDVLPAGEGT